jgi:hypothetical protein
MGSFSIKECINIGRYEMKQLFILFGTLFLFVTSYCGYAQNSNIAQIPVDIGSKIFIYALPFDVLTRAPVDEDYIRSKCDIKVEISGSSVIECQALLNILSKENKKFDVGFIRLLIDVYTGGEKVATIAISDRNTLKGVGNNLYTNTLAGVLGISKMQP